MNDRIRIKGGAGEFEAAVIAVVLDQIARDEKAALQGRAGRSALLPAWIRALAPPEDPEAPRDTVWPD